MNVLLTSVGRRAYMVKYFKSAVGESGQVHVSNSDDLTVAFRYADKSVITPLIYDEEYIPFLLNYCKENRIDVLLSLFDIDLPVLAKNKKKFEKNGVKVIVSDYDLVQICNDKWETYLFLKENGFFVPKTYLRLNEVLNAINEGKLKYPIIVKPRFGCGSIGLSIAENEEELNYLYRKVQQKINESYLSYESAMTEEKIIFQEYLEGQEYGVDIIHDLEGNFCNSIIKKKIAMRAGETDIAEIVDEPILFETTKRLGQFTRHIGNMDCDLFLVEGKPYVLEMNARFGGGYPFSHASGCNLPKAILDWTSGNEVSLDSLKTTNKGRMFKELTIIREF